MNIVAYCRVSTDKTDQLNSLETQKTFFQEYAKRNGDNLVRIYADEGLSGTKTKNRPEFLQLMRDAHHGLFQQVVVKDFSRFSRNTVDFLQNTRELKALNIETMFLTANMGVLGNSEFVLTIFSAMAQEESANTSKRVKFGKKQNAEKGRVPNLVYGYDKIKGDYFNLNINEVEASVVQRIFDLYIQSGYGCNKIAQILNGEGLVTKRNCKWNQNGIGAILTNEIYVGKIVNGKTEIVDFLTSKREEKEEHEWFVVDKPELRIIDDETFQNAGELLKKRNHDFNIKRERHSNQHIFSTLIKCDCCGYSFRRLDRKFKNNKVNWVCSGRNANGVASCDNHSKVNEEELKKILKEYFTQILNNRKDTIKHIVAKFNKVYKSKDENANLEKDLNTSLSKCNRKREKFMDMYEDELISREELREKVKDLNHEIEGIENQLKLIQYNLTRGDQLEIALNKTFQDLEKSLNMDNVDNAALKRIIDKIVVNSDRKVEIYLKLLSDIGLGQSVLVSDVTTQRHLRPTTAF